MATQLLRPAHISLSTVGSRYARCGLLHFARSLCVETRPKKDNNWKKFSGAEEWKNWIDWDSPHKNLTDELNRKRHFFWHVDSKGRLFRRELDQGDKSFGEMKHPPIVDYFFAHMQRNDTGLYVPTYPYLSYRMHERYYTKCELAPIVFTDLVRGPDGGHALKYGATLHERFDAGQLVATADGYLYHPVVTKATRAQSDIKPLYGLLEVTIAQRLLDRADSDADGNLVLDWEGQKLPLRTVDSDAVR